MRRNGSGIHSLLVCTEILAGVCKQRNELFVFLINEQLDDVKLLENDHWCARLAYIANILLNFNELSTWMDEINIFCRA